MFKQKDLFVYAIVFLTRINLSFPNPATVNENEESIYRRNYASKMRSFMNHSVNPCNDFYEYACGNWKNVIENRWTTSKRSNIVDIRYKLNDIVENILKRPHINDVAPEYAAEFKLAKKFYNNCMRAELFPMRASPEYLKVLKQIGGFPAVDTEWKSVNFHWLNMSAHLSNYGIESFVKESIGAQYPFSPHFKMAKFGFDIELHPETIQNSSSNAYKENEKRMRDILTIYGVKNSHVDSTIHEIFSFLKEILKFTQLFPEEDDNCAYLSGMVNKTEIKGKWSVYYDIAWLGKHLNDCCPNCYFWHKIIDIICENNERAAANYLSLKFLFHMDARLQNSKYQKDFCISSLKSSMIYLFDHLYMKLNFNNELRNEISYIVKEIRESLKLIIKEAEWLDETTRNAALLKESTITEHVGRYEDTHLTKLLIRELNRLEFINGSYEANNLNLLKFRQYMMRFNGLNFEKLSNTTKPLDLLVSLRNNAFNYAPDNAIYVLAGFLMEPVYNKFWPNSLKFGTLGSVIGHELTHGFDTNSANFNIKGKKHYWWTDESRNIFEERANCYVNHYKNYFIPEINRYINGKLTKNENIADGVGLRAAFIAYRRFMENNVHPEIAEKMPGLSLVPEKLFFLGYAQMWCSSYREADYWEDIADIHAIDKFRVLGTLSNSADFAEAYSCPVGSKMNPAAAKCEAW